MGHSALRHFVAALFCSFAFSVGAYAQANADTKYNQGLSYQKKMTVADQNKAIECFRSAKKMYDSAKDKKQCDNAIQVSVSIKNNLRSSTNSGKSKRRGSSNRDGGEVRSTVQPMIELSNDYFRIEAEGKAMTVSVTTKSDSWDAVPVSTANGNSFLTVQKKEDDTFEIICQPNTSTKKRSQKVEVSAGDYKKSIVVEQQGVPTILRLDDNLWECSWKGGDKTVEVYCNSETTAKDNNEQNWRVESKPKWVTVTFATKKKKGLLSKAGSFAKKLVKGEAEVNDDPSVRTTMANVIVEKLRSGSSEFTSGRKGEIVFVSDGQRATLMIVQKGK